MTEAMEGRHASLLEEVKIRTEKDHKLLLEGIQKKHQSEMSRLAAKHEARLNELGNKLKRVQEKHESDKVAVRTKAEAHTEELKKLHAEEISRRNKNHEAEVAALENAAKVRDIFFFRAGSMDHAQEHVFS